MKQINLAVDVMGGDKGPKTTIEGIYKASKIFPKVHFRLFGDKQKVFDELNNKGKHEDTLKFDRYRIYEKGELGNIPIYGCAHLTGA